MTKKSVNVKQNHLQFLAPFAFFLFTTVLYLNNLTRDIYSGDVGDLVTAANVFGVAHPPGYPLFTLLGYLFSRLPIDIPPVTKVALVSAISSLLGLFLFFKFSQRFTKSLYISLLSTSILAFSHLYWFHAEIPEVFGLNHLFVIAILLTAILFNQTKKITYFYLLGFLSGLSLTHHHIILFVLPAALYLAAKHFKYIFSTFRIPLYGISFFILGTTPYLYVPFAASLDPVINWDTVTNWDNFVRLVLRKDYGFAPTLQGTTPIQIKMILVRDYFKTLMDLYSYQIIFVGILGLFGLFKKDKWLFGSLLFGFLLSGPFFIFYAAPPVSTVARWGIIERFYSFSTVIFMFFVPSGFLLIKRFLDSKFSRPLYGSIILGYFLIIPLYMLIYNFPKTDLSQTQIGNNLAIDILESTPSNSILYVSGDTSTFNVWYQHYVLGRRQDIGLVNPPRVGGNAFLDDEINKYNRFHPQTSRSNIVNLTLDELRKNKRVFGTYEFDYRPTNTRLIPKGLVYELVDKNSIPEKDTYIQEIEVLLKKYHIARLETLKLSEQNLITVEIPLIYSNALIRTGRFMMEYYKDYPKAEHYYRRALWINPENSEGYAGLALSQFHGSNDCANAITNMQTAIDYYRVWQKYYIQLYTLHQRCKSDQKIINDFRLQYKNAFNREIPR